MEDKVGELIAVKNIHKVFEDATGDTGGAVEAIRMADFRVASSEFVSLLGPSGCGKSTLLDIIELILWTGTHLIPIITPNPTCPRTQERRLDNGN